MTDGFTGIDTGKFKYDLQQLEDAYTSFCTKTTFLFESLFTQTSKVWASPRAIEICNKLYSLIDNFFAETGETSSKFLNLVAQAGSQMAIANGEQISLLMVNLINIYKNGANSIAKSISNIKDNIDGKVGMDVDKMNLIIADFVKSKSRLHMIFNIPQTISIYDSNGNIAKTYQTGSKKIEAKYEELYALILDTMKEQMKDEANKIKIAKIRAQNTLDQIM